jgi:phage-related protein
VAATLVLDIITNASKAVSGISKMDQAAGKAGDAAEKSGSKFGTLAKAAGLAIGGAALGGVIKMFKTGVDEQKDFLDGQAQLANGIKSTGNAAHVSVSGLEDLASSIQNYSGQTDDSIVASEKLLLTFTGVRNAAGKNNDIFNQATKMTADMAAKMGGDASTYAVQLGKALNDPAKGVAKLTKIGVTFTDQQKKQITAMQKAGNTVGAQKVIMAELTKEFGGSAKAAGQTLPGQMKRAQRSFEDISQNLIASLMPVLTALAGFLLNNVMPAFSKVMGFITRNKTVFAILAGAIGGIVAAWKIWNAVLAIWTAITEANPIVLIITALVALGVALVVAYKKSATFRNIVQTAFRAVATAARVVWAAIKLLVGFWIAQFKLVIAIVRAVASGVVTAFRTMVSGIRTAVSVLYAIIVKPYVLAWQWITGTLIPGILSVFRQLPGWIASAISTITAIIKAPFTAAWNWVANTLIPGIVGWVKTLPGKVTTALSGLSEAIKAPFRAAWDWVANSLVPGIVAWVRTLPGKVATALATLAETIKAPFRAGWSWVKTNVIDKVGSAFSGLWSTIKTAMSKVEGAITAPFSAAWTWIKKNVIDKITAGFGALGTALKTPINAVIRAWNNLSFTIGGWKLPFPPHTKFPSVTISTPNLPLLASGAYVTRATAAVVGEGGSEFVAPEPMLRAVIRDELGRAGGNVYNFHVPPTANPAETGRVIVKAIQAYERAAGAGWRSA